MTGAGGSVAGLVVDLGDVACRWLPDRRLVALAERSGLPPALVDRAVFDSGFDDAGERGAYDLAGFTAELAGLLGLDVGDPAVADGLRADWALAYEPQPSVLRLVRRTTVPTALLTNNGPLLEAALDHELAAVGAAFDRCTFSWRLGATKPDPAAFERCAAALGVGDPSTLLFVDDSAANVDAARALGWQGHHHTHALDLTAALSAAGVLGPAAPA